MTVNTVVPITHDQTTPNRLHTLKPISWEDLETLPFEPRQFVIDPILKERQVGMIYAPTGVGKTWVTLSLAVIVASGNGANFLGFQALGEGKKVMLIDGEMDTEDLQQRIGLITGAVHADEDSVRKNLTIYSRQHQAYDAEFPDIVDDTWQNDILAECKREGVQLLVLDNFSTLTASIEDENSAAKVGRANAMLLKAKQAGIACLLVHHANKTGTNYRGSSTLAVTMDVIISLQRPENFVQAEGETAFSLLFDKVRGLLPSRMTMGRTVVLKTEGDAATWREDEHPATQGDRIKQLLESYRFTTQKELAGHLGITEGALSKQITQAVAVGAFTREDMKTCFERAKKLRDADHQSGDQVDGDEEEAVSSPPMASVQDATEAGMKVESDGTDTPSSPPTFH